LALFLKRTMSRSAGSILLGWVIEPFGSVFSCLEKEGLRAPAAAASRGGFVEARAVLRNVARSPSRSTALATTSGRMGLVIDDVVTAAWVGEKEEAPRPGIPYHDSGPRSLVHPARDPF
jgi:hypothetical protein